MTPHTHLSDEQLIARYLAGEESSHAEDGCARCHARAEGLARTLGEVAETATALADAAFPPERLARQRSRILQRLQHLGQQGRVLAFPLRTTRRPSILQPRPLRRWVAAAAAAGLVVGMVAGHMVHELPALERDQAPSMSARASAPLADDDLLREIEAAVGTPLPAGLRRLGDLTPTTWEVQ